jgi:xanthine dehydrogenase iron-sulfur cluster and FAD-binding subunit A
MKALATDYAPLSDMRPVRNTASRRRRICCIDFFLETRPDNPLRRATSASSRCAAGR